jgi:hypothetical protein
VVPELVLEERKDAMSVGLRLMVREEHDVVALSKLLLDALKVLNAHDLGALVINQRAGEVDAKLLVREEGRVVLVGILPLEVRASYILSAELLDPATPLSESALATTIPAACAIQSGVCGMVTHIMRTLTFLAHQLNESGKVFLNVEALPERQVFSTTNHERSMARKCAAGQSRLPKGRFRMKSNWEYFRQGSSQLLLVRTYLLLIGRTRLGQGFRIILHPVH